MANWILPVIAGNDQRMSPVMKAIGIFGSSDEAVMSGMRLMAVKKIVSYSAPMQLMTLKEYNAFLASQNVPAPKKDNNHSNR